MVGLRAGLFAAALGLFLAACGSAAPSAPARTAPPPIATLPPGVPATPAHPILTYQLALTGAVALSGTISQAVPRMHPLEAGQPDTPITCTEVNAQDVNLSGNVGGHSVFLVLTFDDPSPGTRPVGSSSGLMIDSSVEDTNFGSQDDPASTITIGTDGSGKLELTDWLSPTNKTESGTISWTCAPS